MPSPELVFQPDFLAEPAKKPERPAKREGKTMRYVLYHVDRLGLAEEFARGRVSSPEKAMGELRQKLARPGDIPGVGEMVEGELVCVEEDSAEERKLVADSAARYEQLIKNSSAAADAERDRDYQADRAKPDVVA